MIHGTTISTIAKTMTTTRKRLPQPTMTSYIITTLGKQKHQTPMNQISSTSSGISLRVSTSLAPPIDHHLLWVEVRPMIPWRPCSKAFPPYLKALQTQMEMPRVDRKRGVSALYSIQRIFTAQNLHLRIHFPITSIITFTITIARGLPLPVHRVVDRRLQQPAGYGLRMVPMPLRTIGT